MGQKYTSEKNVLYTIALLKKFGIKRIIVSPGSTNVTFVASVQQDDWFELYSCVDERSAAYMACGMAAETREPVVLSCTGATASRNYYPALTEAYYRHLPILAITSTQDISYVGNLVCQVIDRSVQPKDTVVHSVHIGLIKDPSDEKSCILKLNNALLELYRNGGGPVHINLTTAYSEDYSIDRLPDIRKISRYTSEDNFPELSPLQKIVIYIGSHLEWSEEETEAVDKFCQIYNAVAITDITSNFKGKYGINYQLVLDSRDPVDKLDVDLLIHIGDMSDAALTVGHPKRVWRVSEDGELRDRYGVLSAVFQMRIITFFRRYILSEGISVGKDGFLLQCQAKLAEAYERVPDLPFSQLWVARKMSSELPKNSCMHLGILAPLRSWSYWQYAHGIRFYCNQGGFGIDGNISTTLGASLVNPDKLYFVIVGDLSFFYDLNVLGNRHIGSNLRILVINNSLAAEFLLSKQHNIRPVDDIESYISAAGHFGHQSPNLVKNFAIDLGFEYLSASSKSEFENCYKQFLIPEVTEKPMVMEIFTTHKDEDEALRLLWNANYTSSGTGASRIRKGVVRLLGENRYQALKTIIKG